VRPWPRRACRPRCPTPRAPRRTVRCCASPCRARRTGSSGAPPRRRGASASCRRSPRPRGRRGDERAGAGEAARPRAAAPHQLGLVGLLVGHVGRELVRVPVVGLGAVRVGAVHGDGRGGVGRAAGRAAPRRRSGAGAAARSP
jgi:hypothetical protein